MPVSRNAHHSQLAATPPSRTRLVTRLGVLVRRLVAPIKTPTSHHGAARPEVKNSAVLDPARRASHTAGANEIAIERTTMIQSKGLRWTHSPTWLAGSASPPNPAAPGRHCGGTEAKEVAPI